eukprot:CAMPEP_0117459514 /NCGR_PEP_ID=MMETSP0784-20121206/1521_1 /TAXON_ID=39447 /ORGANISM="" /LENGTH=109 /DNA_ID=CAMNT_0005253137 /DNA_START=20 /DNA_END=349 /DNA_ORIENTATION=-
MAMVRLIIKLLQSTNTSNARDKGYISTPNDNVAALEIAITGKTVKRQLRRTTPNIPSAAGNAIESMYSKFLITPSMLAALMGASPVTKVSKSGPRASAKASCNRGNNLP